jgi:hypothetical protein
VREAELFCVVVKSYVNFMQQILAQAFGLRGLRREIQGKKREASSMAQQPSVAPEV